jgi:CHAT domain-containing protein
MFLATIRTASVLFAAFCAAQISLSALQSSARPALAATSEKRTQGDPLQVARRHALSVEKRFGANSAEVAKAWQDYGNLLGNNRQYSEAIVAIRRALSIRVKVLGENHADTAYTLNQLGWLVESIDGDAAAESHFRKALAIRERVFGADHERTIFSVERLGVNLFDQSKFSAAEPYLRRAADVRVRTLGTANGETANSQRLLGDVLEKLNRYQEAVTVYERALAAHEQASGRESVGTALTLNNLGWAHQRLNQIAVAIPYYERAVAIREKLLGVHAHTALTMANLATSYFISGQFNKGMLFADRALAVRRAVLSPDDVEIATSLTQRSIFHQVKGEFVQAERLLEEAVSIFQKRLGPDDERLVTAIEGMVYVNEFQARYSKALDIASNGLKAREAAVGSDDEIVLRLLEGMARNYGYLGRYAESERHYRRVLEARVRLLGADHPDTAGALINLADEYYRQRRFLEAESLYRRSLEVRERVFGPDHYLVALSVSRLGRSLRSQGNYAAAEAAFRRSVDIDEKVHGDHFFTAIALEDLADTYDKLGKTVEAAAIYDRTVAMKERYLGPKHPSVATSLGYLSTFQWKLGQAQEAETSRQRQLSINLESYGPDHDTTALSYSGLAWVQIARGQSAEGLRNYSHATDIFVRRLLSQVPSAAADAAKPSESEIGGNSQIFLNYVHSVFWALPSEERLRPIESAAAKQAFELTQWARLSDTATALSQTSLRALPNNDELGVFVREHQDLSAEWRIADATLAEILSKQSTADQAASVITAKKRLEDVEGRLAQKSAQLRRLFPKYAELSRPQAVSVDTALRLLRSNEVLLQFSLTPTDCFVWLVDSRGVRWSRLEVQHVRLVEMITALRQQIAGGRFNMNLAYAVYQALFGLIEKELEGKHLLIVPTGILTSLPLHILITEKPEALDEDLSERLRKASWMIRRHAITMLPSVSALKALREYPRNSIARRPYLGIGNPLLEGPTGEDRRAWEIKRCSDTLPRAVVAKNDGPPAEVSEFFRGGRGNVDELRKLEPLPETVAELCSVAESFGYADDAIVVGAEANEPNINELNKNGHLADVRVLHFATHGLVAGELRGLAEPALVLSPPFKNQTGDIVASNDGLLTATEIAQFRLNAEWVVLSACNTASGSALGAEALSGLAKAFFYAGARALLVSHWMVDTQAAVKLMVATFDAMAQSPTIGRAEALRRAILDVIDKGASHEVHPRYWAPFVVVGEGSVR